MALASEVNLEIIMKIGCKQVRGQSGFDHHRITLGLCRQPVVIHGEDWLQAGWRAERV